jgi:hypothetical protein
VAKYQRRVKSVSASAACGENGISVAKAEYYGEIMALQWRQSAKIALISGIIENENEMA